jgi:hypothetical protein
MAVRLLRAALPQPELSLERALALVEYHRRRNEIARASHDKRWAAKHEGVEYKLLL